MQDEPLRHESVFIKDRTPSPQSSSFSVRERDSVVAMDSIGARMGGSLVGSKSSFLNDTAPHIPPAGKVTAITGESTARCLEYEERPITPPEQRRFRQSTVHEPATIVRHPGRAMDQLKDGPFGRPTIQPDDEGVCYSIKQMHDSDVRQWIEERSEDVYARCAFTQLLRSPAPSRGAPPAALKGAYGPVAASEPVQQAALALQRSLNDLASVFCPSHPQQQAAGAPRKEHAPRAQAPREGRAGRLREEDQRQGTQHPSASSTPGEGASRVLVLPDRNKHPDGL